MFKNLIAITFYCIATYTYSATLMVQVDFNGNQHQVVNAWLVEQDLPANFRLKGRSNDIQFDLLDEKNQLISSSFTNQPAPIYGAYILATEQEKQQLNEHKLPNKKGSYYLRIPHYQKRMNSIQLSDTSKVNANKVFNENDIQRVLNRPYLLTDLQIK